MVYRIHNIYTYTYILYILYIYVYICIYIYAEDMRIVKLKRKIEKESVSKQLFTNIQHPALVISTNLKKLQFLNIGVG